MLDKLKLGVFLLVFCVVFAGCDKKDEVSKSDKSYEVEIDEKSGLKNIGKLELKYAQSFQVKFLENGVKKYIDVEGREVYLLPKGVELDNKDLITLTVPVDRIAIFSTVDATLLRPLDKLDTVVATTTKQKSWHIKEIKDGLEAGRITYLGSKSNLNNEELQKVNPEVILFTYENLERTPKLIQTFENLDLNWIGMSSHMEKDPRARIEWVKLTGILTDELKKATEYYEEQLAKIAEVEKITAEEKSEKPTFAWTFLFKDLFYTKRAGDYSVKTAELAGGKTIFADLDPENNGNAKLNAEEFYKGSENADFLIYDSVNGSQIQTINDLITYADYMADLKAVKNNNVWRLKANYFQSTDYTADMVKELYDILHDETGQLTETEHFYRMDVE